MILVRTTTPACSVVLLATTLAASPGMAQQAPGAMPGGIPGAGAVVDPNVADHDPLAVSQRFIDPGNAQHSFATRMTLTEFGANWSPHAAAPHPNHPSATHAYQYRSPGVRALIDRPHYVTNDGAQFMVIPANTVFQLTLDQPAPQQAPPTPHENYVDMRLNLEPASTRLEHPVAFPRASSRPDQPTPTADSSQLRFPELAELATPPNPEPRPVIRPVTEKKSDAEDAADTEPSPEATDAETPVDGDTVSAPAE